MRVKIAKWGNSSAVRIPKQVMEKAGLKEGDEIEVETVGSLVKFSPIVKRYTIEELFAEAQKSGPLEVPPLIDFGPPVGLERWPDEDWSDIAPTDEEMGIVRDAAGRRSRPGSR